MPTFLLTVFDALVQSSGWTFVVLAGGPVPKNSGKVFIEELVSIVITVVYDAHR